MGNFLRVALLSCFVISCSDGDLQIETIDFDSVTVQSCDSPQPDTSNLLFKLNTSESLILELQSGALNNGVVGDTITTESAVPGQSKLTYRIFDDNVSTNYFCDDVPPVSPIVLDEIEAQDGLVIIETMANEDSTSFIHTISLSGVSFVTESGERITNLSINEFGEVTTAVPD
ncbi:hypothetical protein GTQ34_00695 [Muricauda sp. JGD-17]|uniref:Uncharacterized protein n=1 Tax=Flagellimonas ochracea TaxID=2696472 RepID=A0A964T8Z6_9FLAO|nr:hypothetical protein [Allomuricauda ochracea]NAY90424.1 hypothetical protein [Allomuricauda ochracea]